MTSQVCEYLCVLPLVQELWPRDGISSKRNIHLPRSGFSIIKQSLQHPAAGSAASTEYTAHPGSSLYATLKNRGAQLE